MVRDPVAADLLDPDGPAVKPSLPIKDVEFVSADTDLTMGEWAIIKPLFVLYVERENATRLEASRGLGVDAFGRTTSEVAQDIERMETETIPAKRWFTPSSR